MLKKIFVFILPLIWSLQASAVAAPEAPVSTDNKIGEQVEAVPTDPPSQEVDYVEESELVREMSRAQKAHNAEEYDSYGGGITIIAMCIVIGALVVLSILFYIFGKISSWFLTHKKNQSNKVFKSEASSVDSKAKAPDTGDVIAAISAALAQHFATDHDMQDTILTIKKLRKAYSPWNSKIYNMRHSPEVIHTVHPKLGK